MSKQQGKVFVGGLSWETSDERLRAFFENFGTVLEAFVSYDRHTGRPRGFGFVVFEDPAVADKVVSLQHTIDRREVEAKKAVPKEEHPSGRPFDSGNPQRTKKVFVGGLAPSVDENVLKAYFERFGEVEDAVVMYDHDNKRPRGFGFITFTTEEAVDGVFTGGTMQTLHDKPIEIKRAVPRDQMGPSARALPTRASYFPSAARSGLGAARPVGFNIPGAAAFSPTALAGRNYSGLSLGSLNGGLTAQDFSRAGGDLLQQMTALSLAGGGQMGLASLAQNISQGLAGQGGLGGAGGGLSLSHSGMLLGSPGGAQQAQQQQSSLASQQHLAARISLGNGFGSLPSQRSGVSPTTASALRANSLEDAYQSAFAAGGPLSGHEQAAAPQPPPPQHQHQQQQQLPHLHQQPQQQQQHPLHAQGVGSAFPSSQALQGYREEGSSLGAISTLTRDLSGAFSGSFTPHKEPSSLSAEHQWSLSS